MRSMITENPILSDPSDVWHNEIEHRVCYSMISITGYETVEIAYKDPVQAKQHAEELSGRATVIPGTVRVQSRQIACTDWSDELVY